MKNRSNKRNPKMSDVELLKEIARKVMLERELLIDFPEPVKAELAQINHPATIEDAADIVDLRDLLWCSIDNDDSMDLDQLTVAEVLPDGGSRIRVAVADVDALVPEGSKIDQHAAHNTTSVYTAAELFPMLPEKLSTDLTSLNPDEDRVAMIIDMTIDENGAVSDSSIYRAVVHNHAKLAYNSVAAWLDGVGEMPAPMANVEGLADNIRLQNATAKRLRQVRARHGALNLETIQTRAIFENGEVVELAIDERNAAKELIEDFMIAANGTTARFLKAHGFPSIRRVVRTPDRWDNIVSLAQEYDYALPGKPDSKALNGFLLERKRVDPLRFPDVSLTVIKLLGSGEYVAEKDGLEAPGHFSLAIKDYSHSTAPNRRYPDVITQRLLKACLAGQQPSYSFEELDELAWHLTNQEDVVTKVERSVSKSAAALLLEDHIGELFSGLVTGASDKGTWVRILEIPVEGKLVAGGRGLEVGERVTVKLVSVNVEKGFIDFTRMKTRRR